MSAQDDKPKRGRPQTLDRDTVLKTALMSYWTEGPTRVAISSICQMANVSKPGLYREFGSDDGLKNAVLDLYREMVLAPFYDILTSNESFDQQVEALISFTIQDRHPLGIPSGCLQVAMRAHKEELGEITRGKVEVLRRETLLNYERWIERAKSRGEFKASISSEAAAHFCDAQNNGAMRMQNEGVPNEVIRKTLKLAFSVMV
ncbi:AcrR protein [Rhodobacterales bacterium HTCC2150]|nr:AcrR protein [Rhodobacterales bacterium HTCC2150] [Rhodobacteraceae bacterium HTCC2150]